MTVAEAANHRLLQERLLHWAADHNVGFHSRPSRDSAIAGDADEDFENFWQKLAPSLDCVPVETLRLGVQDFIEHQAMIFWLEESLDEDGTMPRHVLAEIADRVPGFRDACDEYRREHPNEVVDYGTVLLARHDAFRFSPNAWAIFSLAMLDTRTLRLQEYNASRSRRSRVKPHPPFEDWYSKVLEYPLTGDDPAVRRKHSRRQLDRIWDVYESLLGAPCLEGDDLFAMLAQSLRKTLDTLRVVLTTTEHSASTNDGALAALPTAAAKTTIASLTAPRRERVEAFLAGVRRETHERVSKADIWRVAGDRTKVGFQDWQADRTTSAAAAAAFEDVLRMEPEEFVKAALKKRPTRG